MTLHIHVNTESDAGLRRLLARAARAALAMHEIADAELSITLLDDDAIAALNARYRQHTGPTDVLSFSLHSTGEPPQGDIYIGREQAVRQAEALGVPPREECVRLTVHGTLHVLGYDHPEGAGREESPMWQLQEALVHEVIGS